MHPDSLLTVPAWMFHACLIMSWLLLDMVPFLFRDVLTCFMPLQYLCVLHIIGANVPALLVLLFLGLQVNRSNLGLLERYLLENSNWNPERDHSHAQDVEKLKIKMASLESIWAEGSGQFVNPNYRERQIPPKKLRLQTLLSWNRYQMLIKSENNSAKISNK